MTTYTLPARFALKGSNGKFLKDVSHKGQTYLTFSSLEDTTSVFLAQEVNGYYGIKSEILDKFWRREDDNVIVVKSPDSTDTDTNTLFWALVVSGNKITLHNAGNEAICGVLTTDPRLSASGHTTIFEVIDLPLSS